MNSKYYWAQREAEATENYIKDEAEYSRQINKIYSNMLDACQKEIDAFYGKYAAKEGITIAEAKKRVSSLDIAEYERKAKRYVKEKDFSDKANEEMRLYNATMKINRLEMLKANIGLELINGHDEIDKFMGGILKGRTEEELARQAGILGKTVRSNSRLAHTIPNGSFHNATFSDRIWMYQDIMKSDLGKLLQSGLIQGKNSRAISKDLKKYWYGNDPKTGKGAVYCMERLMRTELARVQTEAQKQSFERNGFDKYIFIVNAGCCGHCEEVAEKDSGYGKGVYLVKDMQPGLNAPPIHPNDRCSTAAYEDSKEYEEWIDFLANGGTTADFEALKAKGGKVTTPKEKAESKAKTAGNYKSYKTLSNYDDNIEWKTEQLRENLKECRYLPAKFHAPFDTFEKETPKFLKQLSTAFEKFDFSTNTDSSAIVKILKDGKLKGLLETGTSNGFNDADMRRGATGTLFGLYDTVDTLKADQFEKYGYLGKADRAKSLYGDCRIVLKKANLWDRTTFTVGDSLEGYDNGAMRIPSLVSKPEIVSIGTDIFSPDMPAVNETVINTLQKNFDSIEKNGYFQGIISNQDYVELQFHGAVTLDDIDYIEVPASSKNIKEIQELAAQKNVKVKVKKR